MRKYLTPFFAVGFPLILVAFSVPAQIQSQSVADFEDLDKTMVLFERAFAMADEKLLRSISTREFERSPEFKRLSEGLGRLRINSALSSQTAEQIFDLEPGPGELVVLFRLRERHWLVESAVIRGVRHTESSNRIPLLAREYYFSDFRRLMEAGKASAIATATPNALSDPRLKGKKFSARAMTTVTVTDLAVSEGERLADLIFLRLRKSDKVDQLSRGWLIDASGTMLDHARASGHNSALVDYLSGNQKAFSARRDSAFVFANAEASDEPAMPTTHVDFRVERIATSGFKWDGKTVQFLLSVDCSGASWQPPYKVFLEGGRLKVTTQSDARFVGSPPPHRYLRVKIDDGVLNIDVNDDVPRRPIATFENAVIKRHWTRAIGGGIRFIVELSGDPLAEVE